MRMLQALGNLFIAGTDQCDIWEVDKDPRVLVEGHEVCVYPCVCGVKAPPNLLACYELRRGEGGSPEDVGEW